ncbi:MAG: LacI family DNA-binding transcriptional regulator [Clostridium sp.]
MNENRIHFTKRLTIKDIAEMANISKTTVSFYLNEKFEKMSEETRLRIKKVIEETNYSPSITARCLTSKKSNLIGVIVGDVGNPFSANIVKGIDSICRDNNFQIIVGSSGFKYENEVNYVNKMIDMGVDGFIMQTTVDFVNMTAYIQDMGKKIVLLDSVTDSFNGKWVKTDNFNDTRKATKELIKKGFEKLVLITEDPSLLMARIERKKGFEEACIEEKKEYEVKIIDKKIENKEMMDLVNKSISESEKSAIFCSNGFVLKKVFDSIKEYNSELFKKIGLIGYDNWDWTEYATPAVTNIEQPTYEEGRYAAELLIDELSGEKNKKAKIFKSKVNWNESTNIYSSEVTNSIYK